jgi:hypothetical protein
MVVGGFTLLFVLTFIGQTGAQTCVQPPTNLVAWWPLDEASGTIVADIAGDNPGIHVNGPVPAAGKVGGALRFDGSNDFVGVGDSDLWAFGAHDFTIEFWANFDAPGGGSIGHPGDIFIGNDEGPFTTNKWLFALGGGVLEFVFSSPAIGDHFLLFNSFAPNVGQWYHLAIKREGSTFTAFINGTPAGSAIDTFAIANPNAPLTIGQAEELGFMNGRLDEVTIYHRALAPEEIAAIFNAGGVGKCKALTITTELLSVAKLGELYSQELKAMFGVPPLSWAIIDGALPSGLELSPEGVLSGTPLEAGDFTFTIQLTDSDGESAEKPFIFKVLITLPPPNIRVRKAGTVPVPGRTLDYFIVVENAGIATAKDVGSCLAIVQLVISS